MDETTLFATIVGGLLIIGVLFVGFSIFTSFYDLDSFEGEGELDIDTDAIDDLGDSMEDASDAIFENFDGDGIMSALASWSVFIVIIIGSVLVIRILTKT